MVRTFFGAIAVSLASLAVSPSATAADKPAPPDGSLTPRYQFKVGQELSYAGTSNFKYENGELHYKKSTKLLVIGENPGGGWRLLVLQGSSFAQTPKENDKPQFSPERLTVAYCDITPDGRVTDNPTLGFMASVRGALPQLPPDAKSTWESADTVTGERHVYSLAAANANETGHVVIVDERHSPEDEVYVSSTKMKFAFDVKRGLVDGIESESTQGYGFNGHGTGTTKLAGVDECDLAVCRQVTADIDRFFPAKQEYDELLERAAKETGRTDDLLGQAKTKLESLRKDVQSPVIREQLDKKLEQHEQMVKYTKDDAERYAAVLGKPSTAWETTDLDGSTRSIEGCRGKVVVLDFWYRGCGWCIRAMPQVKEVAAHYQGQPVEVFGMNTDQKDEDARFVIDKLKLNYPTLHARDEKQNLPEKYGVTGFPTLVIIDQAGVVRDLHVGYSPHLAADVMASVDKLLAEK
ncbi:MAG: redoxin family protein [Planctomycetia bacterium]|nr:redoxin family protein [Planctomycetia bacterium]